MSTIQTESEVLLQELLSTPQGHANPYPLYRRLLRSTPLLRSGIDGAWYAFRYTDCRKLLLDPACSVRPGGEHSKDRSAQPAEHGGRLSDSMVMHDPPEHTRLRRLVSWAFTPSKVHELRSRVIELVDAALDSINGRVEVDFMAEVAYPLPAAVIGEVVGISPEQAARFVELSEVGISVAPGSDATELERAKQADARLEASFVEIIEQRRSYPAGDLVGTLVEMSEESGLVSNAEIISTVILLFIAGVLTTTHFIGNGLLALLRHPAELARLRREPRLIPSAVEEMLRYDGPVQVVARTLRMPVELSEGALEPGDRVVAVLGAANRDPDRFAEPDRFDASRPNNSALSFGWGIHHCLGIHLARLEGQVLFRRLLERFSSVDLAMEHPPILPGLMIRGPAVLPVRLTSK